MENFLPMADCIWNEEETIKLSLRPSLLGLAHLHRGLRTCRALLVSVCGPMMLLSIENPTLSLCLDDVPFRVT